MKRNPPQAESWTFYEVVKNTDQVSNSEASAMRVAMASPWGQAFSALE
jgi:hypothetical protein